MRNKPASFGGRLFLGVRRDIAALWSGIKLPRGELHGSEGGLSSQRVSFPAISRLRLKAVLPHRSPELSLNLGPVSRETTLPWWFKVRTTHFEEMD